jgi:uncharacterized protein (TIGR04255 family)
MPFPPVKRVLYGKNPLDEVICQLRFPPILKIDAELPANFQEIVRKQFPNFLESSEMNVVEVHPSISGQIPPEILRQFVQAQSNKNYEFSSDDKTWKINLTRTFIALTTKKYQRWEEFRDKLQVPLEALEKVYSPDYLSRVGLRYIDVIKRSELNLKDVSWDELIRPYISGVLGSPEVGKFVKNFESKYEIQLSDNESIVRIIAKFVEPKEAKGDKEIFFMIDSDFYNQKKTDLPSAFKTLDYLNSRASRLIQWCITDRLHTAMEFKDL